jgi:hypothetical protein
VKSFWGLEEVMRLSTLVLLLLLAVGAFGQGPTVYINGDEGISGSSGGFALGGIGVASASVGKHDKTSEMARILLASCPEISLTVDGSIAHLDYLLLLHHEDGYYGGIAQIMVLRPDKSVLFASKQSRISRIMKDGCKVIMADWKDRRPHTAETSDPKSNWNIVKPTAPVASASEPPARQP